MKLVVAADHGGFEYKNEIVKYLQSKGFDVEDLGTYSKDSCDYPIYGRAAAEKVAKKEADLGILVCTSGEGIAIAANKIKGIRCGIGYSDDVAHLMREHNHANMIAFGQSQMKIEDILRRIDLFLEAKELDGRHQRRVDEIE